MTGSDILGLLAVFGVTVFCTGLMLSPGTFADACYRFWDWHKARRRQADVRRRLASVAAELGTWRDLLQPEARK